MQFPWLNHGTSRLRRISQFARIEIAEATPPTMADVKTAKIASIFAKVKTELDSKNIGEYRSLLKNQKMAAEDFAAGMLQLALKKFDKDTQEEALFGGLHEKKYTGFKAEARLKSARNGRDAGSGRRGRFSEDGNGRRAPDNRYQGAREGSYRDQRASSKAFDNGFRNGPNNRNRSIEGSSRFSDRAIQGAPRPRSEI